VHGRDRGLEGIDAGSPQPQGGVPTRAALGDLLVVPQRTVLLGQADKAAGRVDPRRAARVVQQHERKQAVGLGVVGMSATSNRPRRMASAHSSARTRSSPADAAQPSLKTR
jgi:hypothetical protein